MLPLSRLLSKYWIPALQPPFYLVFRERLLNSLNEIQCGILGHPERRGTTWLLL